jgi:hypothetical protein
METQGLAVIDITTGSAVARALTEVGGGGRRVVSCSHEPDLPTLVTGGASSLQVPRLNHSGGRVCTCAFVFRSWVGDACRRGELIQCS